MAGSELEPSTCSRGAQIPTSSAREGLRTASGAPLRGTSEKGERRLCESAGHPAKKDAKRPFWKRLVGDTK